MRICTPGTDEDGFDGGVVMEVVGEGVFHRSGVAGEGEVVGLQGRVDEVVDLGEGMWGDDVDRAESLWEVEGACGSGFVGGG